MAMEPENMLKGRMAESLVEELFKLCGYKVYRFGYEAILQNLTQIDASFDVDDDVAQRIRAIPDFIVIDKNKKPIFIEVKFRWNAEGHEKDIAMLKRINSYWPSKVIFINCSEKPYIRISEPPYLDAQEKIIFSDLRDSICIDIGKESLEKIENLVDKYLKPTLRKEEVGVKQVKFDYFDLRWNKIEKIIKKIIKK